MDSICSICWIIVWMVVIAGGVTTMAVWFWNKIKDSL